MNLNLSELSWADAKKLASKVGTVLIPVGSFEQHGPHLPLTTDTEIAYEIAVRASKLAGVALAPPIAFGFSIEHMGFSGTISLSPETFLRMVKDVGRSLAMHGFKKLVFVNAHGGNTGLLTALIQELRSELDVTAILASVWELGREASKKILHKTSALGHGDEFETSIMLAISPNKVKLSRLKTIKPSDDAMGLRFVGIKSGWRSEDYSRRGVIGDPRRASADKGRLLIEMIVEGLGRYLRSA